MPSQYVDSRIVRIVDDVGMQDGDLGAIAASLRIQIQDRRLAHLHFALTLRPIRQGFVSIRKPVRLVARRANWKIRVMRRVVGEPTRTFQLLRLARECLPQSVVIVSVTIGYISGASSRSVVRMWRRTRQESHAGHCNALHMSHLSARGIPLAYGRDSRIRPWSKSLRPHSRAASLVLTSV